jgi:hypothetical protein
VQIGDLPPKQIGDGHRRAIPNSFLNVICPPIQIAEQRRKLLLEIRSQILLYYLLNDWMLELQSDFLHFYYTCAKMGGTCVWSHIVRDYIFVHVLLVVFRGLGNPVQLSGYHSQQRIYWVLSLSCAQQHLRVVFDTDLPYCLYYPRCVDLPTVIDKHTQPPLMRRIALNSRRVRTTPQSYHQTGWKVCDRPTRHSS